MKPYIVELLPINYKKDEELFNLLAEATEKYTEYKTLLKIFKFNSKMFLDALLKNESLRSSRIEGTEISHEDLYYLEYKKQNDDVLEIKNTKLALEYAAREIKDNKKLDLRILNNIHKILLNSGRGSNKDPGVIRTKQNYISGSLGVTFVPPEYEYVPMLLQNLFEYMNDKHIEQPLINIALSHLQFETIHPYLDGNGRLGRILIPIQLAYLKQEEPILFLSEIIEVYKPTYYRTLNDSRKGNYLPFIKFFLQCVTDQCSANISKIYKVNEIYEEDKGLIEEEINGVIVLKVFQFMLSNVVFNIKEISEELKIASSSISRVLNKLVDLNIIIKEKRENTNRITYRYKRIYDIFVGVDYWKELYEQFKRNIKRNIKS